MELKSEAYKELKSEYKYYQFLIQRLWTYKFAVIGSVLAAAIFNERIVDLSNDTELDLAIFGFLFIPILSFLIDLKALVQ